MAFQTSSSYYTGSSGCDYPSSRGSCQPVPLIIGIVLLVIAIILIVVVSVFAPTLSVFAIWLLSVTIVKALIVGVIATSLGICSR